jgi:PAS domain S-box-containing protein
VTDSVDAQDGSFVSDAVGLFEQLRGYDERHDTAFDEIVSIASTVCDTPIALVSFVNDELQWFRAKVGLDITGTPREVAFCAHTVESGQMLVVGDTEADARFVDNPLVVSDPHIRFYAGTPLRVGDQPALGTLCVLDRRPRELTPRQLGALEALGHQVERLLELQIATAERAAHHAELLERDHRFANVIRSLAQGVVVHASDGRIERTNPAAEHGLGLSESQLLGLTPIDLAWNVVHPDGSPFPGAEHPASITLATGRKVPGMVMGVRRHDGQCRWLVVSSAPLMDSMNRAAGAVATFVDATDLLDSNTRLQQSLDHITASTIERAALLAAMSHDLRAPLGAIKIRTELLREHSAELSVEQTTSILHQLNDDATETSKMLDIVVATDRSIAELLPPHRVEVDLADLVASAVTSFALTTHTLNAVVETAPAIILADPLQLDRIINNLISNAIAYTPPGTTIEVRVCSTPYWIELSVDDDGPGVSTEDVATIFDAYTRGATTEPKPGTGLGLFLVQRFAEFHDGIARYEHSTRGGARFSVQFPVGDQDRPRAPTIPKL